MRPAIVSTVLLCLLLVSCGRERVLRSIDVIPGQQSMSRIGESTQFIAQGHFNRHPMAEDITQRVTWSSADEAVATVAPGGRALATGFGGTTIVATSTLGSSGSHIVGTALVNVAPLPQPRLTIELTGPGTGRVVSQPPFSFDCPGVCSQEVAFNSVITLNATAATGSTFVEWVGCDTTNGNQCTVTMSTNRTVQAFFGLP